MEKRHAVLALGAIALVGVGVVIGTAVSRTDTHEGGKPAAPQAPVKEAATPDTYRSLRDLLGVTLSGQLREVPGQRAVLWGNYDFAHNGSNYHVAFFALKPLDSTGAPETCHACAPDLAAVTYRRTAAGWEIAATDPSITRLGGYGEPPAANKISALTLGATPAMVINDSGTGQGYSASGAYLLAYRDGWKFLGVVPTAEDNTGSSECVQDRRCWSWKGNMKVLSTDSQGLPDIAVERQGMQQQEPGGKLLPAGTVTYQFTENVYYEKGKTPPPTPAPVQAQAPAMQQESVTAPSSTRQWYAPDVNFTRCVRSRSPADRIRMIQDYGKSPRVTDLPNGAVEVAEQTTTADEQVWTYYPSEDACTAALPRSQPIPSRYR